MADCLRALTHQEIKDIIGRIMSLNQKRRRPLYEKKRLQIMCVQLQQDLRKILINPDMIHEFVERIIRDFVDSHISAGEMVGITCAQSIGERQTQMSVGYDHNVWIRRTDRNTGDTLSHYVGPIGEFIDDCMEKHRDHVLQMMDGSPNSHILPTQNIATVDMIHAITPDGRVHWSPIREYSRHPPNGPIQRTFTCSGRVIETTLSHSLLGSTDPIGRTTLRSGVVPVLASEVVPDRTVMPRSKDRDYDKPERCRFVSRLDASRYKDSIIAVSQALISQAEEKRNRNRITENTIVTAIQGLCVLTESSQMHKEAMTTIQEFHHELHKKRSVSGQILFDFRSTTEKQFLQMMLIALEITGIHHRSIWRHTNNLNNGNLTLEWLERHFEESWDRVVRIARFQEKVYKTRHPFVYDLSVEDETFLLLDGIYVHNTLNTFHSAGLAVQTVLSGVPRFMELLNATKEPRYSSTRFQLPKSVEYKTINDMRNIIRNRLVFMTMKDVIRTSDVFTTSSEEIWYDAFEVIFSDRFRDLDKGVRLHLDQEILFQYRIRLDDIARLLESKFEDIACVFSPQHLGQIDIYIDTSLIPCVTDENTPFINGDNYETYFIENVFLPKLGETPICGITGVKEYVVQKENNEFWIITNGNNFSTILGLDWIDQKTACSNNMWDIYHTLGIEATRQFLIDEFRSVISSDGTFIHPSHIALLVDIMTYQGIILSVSRYGMKKEQTSPLAKASFEECLDHFLTAGFIGEEENIEGVSASIICGKRSKIGTGLCKLVFDPTVLT